MDLKERKIEMNRLRHEEGWTLQRIGDHFGISRERVRQVLGNSGNLHSIRKKKILSPLYAWYTDEELAEKLGYSAHYVFHVRKNRFRANGNEESRMEIGLAIRSILEDVHGWQVESNGTKKGVSYTFLLNGCVKVGLRTRSGRKTSPRAKNPLYQFTTHYVGPYTKPDVDFFICVCIDTPKLDTFIVPASVVPKTAQNINITWPSTYLPNGGNRKYFERWDLLEKFYGDRCGKG